MHGLDMFILGECLLSILCGTVIIILPLVIHRFEPTCLVLHRFEPTCGLLP
jgi:hypothetical protein